MVCQDVRPSLPDHYTLISCLTKCCKLPTALNLAVGCKSCAAELSDMDVIPRDTGLSTKCRCGVSCLFLPHESEDKDSLLKWSLKNWMPANPVYPVLAQCGSAVQRKAMLHWIKSSSTVSAGMYLPSFYLYLCPSLTVLLVLIFHPALKNYIFTPHRRDLSLRCLHQEIFCPGTDECRRYIFWGCSPSWNFQTMGSCTGPQTCFLIY